MIAIPAVDLRDGVCVQLAPGSYDTELIRIPDPLGVALAWRKYGFHHLHVVDLDAVSGRGDNGEQIREILHSADLEVQAGGGIHSRAAIQQLVSEGARRVVIGTRAIEDPDWLAEMSVLFPQFILVAADVRDRRLLSRGWTRRHSKLATDLVEELNGLPLAGMLTTSIQREGTMQGPDLPLMEDIAEIAEFPVYAAGGIGSLNDLRSLADRGVSTAIVGMALYTGALNPRLVAAEFCATEDSLT